MKVTTREITIATTHVENALISYLKPFFPEAVEIAGVDIKLPLSAQPGTFQLAVYLKANDKKAPANDNNPQQELPLESPKAEQKAEVVELAKHATKRASASEAGPAKKTNNKRKS